MAVSLMCVPICHLCDNHHSARNKVSEMETGRNRFHRGPNEFRAFLFKWTGVPRQSILLMNKPHQRDSAEFKPVNPQFKFQVVAQSFPALILKIGQGPMEILPFPRTIFRRQAYVRDKAPEAVSQFQPGTLAHAINVSAAAKIFHDLFEKCILRKSLGFR